MKWTNIDSSCLFQIFYNEVHKMIWHFFLIWMVVLTHYKYPLRLDWIHLLLGHGFPSYWFTIMWLDASVAQNKFDRWDSSCGNNHLLGRNSDKAFILIRLHLSLSFRISTANKCMNMTESCEVDSTHYKQIGKW